MRKNKRYFVVAVSTMFASMLGCASSNSSSTGEADPLHPDLLATDAGNDAPASLDTEAIDAATVTAPVVTYGQKYLGGQFHLGPVDYTETAWHNACAPATKYDSRVQSVEGQLLAGLWGSIPGVAGDCDACVHIVTGKGKSATLRVVTYGSTTMNSIDVSPAAYALLNSGEYPRTMTWQLAKCPESGPMQYEFQTGANEWWTSLWIRNARVPIATVEVKSANHAAYVPLTRGTDGTLTDGSGFGHGTFSIRTTAIDGQQIVDTFTWPAAGIGGAFVTGKVEFK